MAVVHFELLVEEPSMEAFLRNLLPRLVPRDRTFGIHPFQGKGDLLGKLEERLRGYAAWLPPDWRIFVVVDRDDDDCLLLKRKMEAVARNAGLRTRSQTKRSPWQVVNRIAIEELEAWYFSDWEAVRAAYPRTSANVPRRQAYREPDGILGGTWEAFERVMRQSGYFKGGLAKIEAARKIGIHFVPERSTSPSFLALHHAFGDALAS